MTAARVLVRQHRSLSGVYEMLCPCCAHRKPGVAVLLTEASWALAVAYADQHSKDHR